MTPNRLQEFHIYYDTYAPKLWGILLKAGLSDTESQKILMNTLSTAWPQYNQTTTNQRSFFLQLLRLAHQEGLPLSKELFFPTLVQIRLGGT